MSMSGLPFDDIRDLISNLPFGNADIGQIANHKSAVLAETFGFGGKEAMLCEWLSLHSGKSPIVSRPMVALFAGTHKAAENVDWSGETTLDAVTRMAAGGAPINQVCAVNDIGLKVFDLALQYPVEDITRNDAMDEKGSAATIGFGMEAIAGGVDVLGLGAFGQGSEIANAAILSAMTAKPADVFVAHFPNELAQSISEHATKAVARTKGDPLEVLRQLGGREHSALVGAILAARSNHVPVILDGMSAIAVGLILKKMDASILDHCVFANQLAATKDNDVEGLQQVQRFIGYANILEGFSMTEDCSALGHAMGVLKSIVSVHANSVVQKA